jgi:hypothetical protein
MSRLPGRGGAPFQLTVVAAFLIASVFLAPVARAAGPPLILESWVENESVSATGASLRALINPNGLSTTFRFEYITEAAYKANLEAVPPKAGFTGATKIPTEAQPAGLVGSGTSPLMVFKNPGNLTPATAYYYRPVATNSAGTTIGPEHVFATEEGTSLFRLPDGRGWEMVSPVDKAGGAIATPGSLFGGGEFQAATASSAVAYGSATSFGNAAGAPPASQYVSSRTNSGWVTQNISTPVESGAYGDEPDGAPYRVFSADLSQGLLFGGLPCRGGLPGCPAPNPVLPGTGAPAGYMAYYLRGASTISSLLTSADLAHSSVSTEGFEVSFAGASPDLASVVLSSCAKLTANATEVPGGPGECDPEETNLYKRSAGGLTLVNTPSLTGAELAAPVSAVSSDGSRVYWSQAGNLHLRNGVADVAVDQGEGATFQGASSDGTLAFFTKANHLYRFKSTTTTSTDLTPSGGVVGVLGVSADGSTAYYQDGAGIQRWREGSVTQVAAGAGTATPSDYEPPTIGTTRVSSDGSHLLFLSSKELSGFDNAGHVEAYVYGPPVGGGTPELICASCNPTGERAGGDTTIPGTLVNGSTLTYRPRVLSTSGHRLFFTSDDVLAVQDTNQHPDVYQWEAQGEGDCTRSPGCANLISSGRSPEGAIFIDASANGSDVYFTTDGSLVGADPGSIDLYDARIGGGFTEALKPIPCIADACQSLPASPEDPDPGTLVKNSGNPQLQIAVEKKKKKHKRKKPKHGKGKKHGKGGKLNGKGKYHVPLKRDGGGAGR